MTDADLEKHTDILSEAIADIVRRVHELTPDDDKQQELATELEVGSPIQCTERVYGPSAHR